MKKVNRAWALAVALLLLAPTYVLAALVQSGDPASKDFPSPVAADGDLSFRLVLSHGVDAVDTDSVPAAALILDGMLAADSGDKVSTRAFNAMCTAATDNPNYICTDPGPADGGVCDAVDGVVETADCSFPSAVGGDKVWRLQKVLVPIPKILITPLTPDTPKGFKINGLHHSTKASLEVFDDILPQYCVRVDRGSPAVDGNIIFTVDDGTPSSFTVNSTGKTDEALHQEIRNGFSAQGLTASFRPNAGGNCRFGEKFQGPTVFLPNVPASYRIGVKGVQGQNVSAETSLAGGNIPTLSEWGLILLAGILAISALWMLRRRSQTGSPA